MVVCGIFGLGCAASSIEVVAQVLVSTRKVNYTAADAPQLLHDLNLTQQVQPCNSDSLPNLLIQVAVYCRSANVRAADERALNPTSRLHSCRDLFLSIFLG